MNQIFTIGYEGGDHERLVRTLLHHQVDVLLDVREMPLSRKRGLSKSALSASLPRVGITYAHERGLGAPREIRNALRETGDLAAYFAHFGAYMDTQAALLASVSKRYKGRVALMCFEANWSECHRSTVAARLAALIHRTPHHLVLEKTHVEFGARMHPGQSLPAA